MSSGFGLVVRFTLRDEAAAAGFDELVAQTLPEIRKHEPGTLAYVVHSVPGEVLTRVFYELYADKAAFEAHEEQEHTKRFLAARGEFLEGFEVTFLEAQAGKGPVSS